MKRLLYVEDEDDLRHLFGHFLRRRGWEVIEAGDGREALIAYHLELKEGRYFDVILLDVMLPKMSGVAVGINIRNIETFSEGVPRARHVYMTAVDVPDEEKLVEAHFADAVVRKPVDPPDLLRALEGEGE